MVARQFKCLINMMEIAVLSEMGEAAIFKRPPGHQAAAEVVRQLYADSLSDHLTLLNVYAAFKSARDIAASNKSFSLESWCKMQFLDGQALEEAHEAIRSLGKDLGQLGIPASRTSSRSRTTIRKVLAIAFHTQCAIRHPKTREYRTVHGNASGLVSKNSSLSAKDDHQWIVYTSFSRQGFRHYFNVATAIDPKWICVSFHHILQ